MLEYDVWAEDVKVQKKERKFRHQDSWGVDKIINDESLDD